MKPSKRDIVTSPRAIAMRLRVLTFEMNECARLMQSRCDAHYDKHAAELEAAANVVREWCKNIEQDGSIHMPPKHDPALVKQILDHIEKMGPAI